MKLLKQSTSVLIVRDDLKILGVSRKDNNKLFGLPGGKTEDKDSSLNCSASRELFEETNLWIDPCDLIPVHSAICDHFQIDNYFFNTTFIIGKNNICDLSLIKQIEGEGLVAWIPAELLMFGPFKEYNQTLLDSINYKIKYIRFSNNYKNYKDILNKIKEEDVITMSKRDELLSMIEVC